MKPLNKKIALLLLIVMGSIITIGVVQSDASSIPDPTDCFGVGCGSVEHISLHVYVIPNQAIIESPVTFFSKTSNSFVYPWHTYLSPESPPPKTLS